MPDPMPNLAPLPRETLDTRGITCECGKPAELTPREAEAYLEAKSHFPFIAPPKCKACREARAV
jgi:hypothetical protein